MLVDARVLAMVAPKSAESAVCMNQDWECEMCVFNEGRLARWCPPAERQAKAALDALLMRRRA